MVGLGGFTSIVGDQGKEVKAMFSNRELVVTSGNTFTAALCLDGIYKAAEFFNKRLEESCITIVGATGDIGSVCAKVLSNKSKQITLCSRGIEESSDLVKEIRKSSRAIVKLENNSEKSVKDADFVLLATSSFIPMVNIKDFKHRSIVCDVSLPHNIAQGGMGERNDVFVFDGGRASLPKTKRTFSKKWAGFTPNNSVYGCLAEGIILGFEGKLEDYSLGRGQIDIFRIEEIIKMGKSHGIELAPFAFYDRPYQINELNDYKRIIGNN